MNLKFISKNLDEEGLKVARDMLSKINPDIRKELVSWSLRYPRHLKSFFHCIKPITMLSRSGKKN